MAKGADSDEFVVLSRVRTGLKREFAFAMKAQSEICGGSLGRTRASKNRVEAPVQPASARKRSRKSEEPKTSEDAMSEEEVKSDVVDLQSDDNNHVGESESAAMQVCEEEPKMLEPKPEPVISEEEPKVLDDVINEEEAVVAETLKGEEPIVAETLKEEVVDEMAEQPLCKEESEKGVSDEMAEQPLCEEESEKGVSDEMAEQPLCEEEPEKGGVSEEKDSNGVALALVNDDGDEGNKKKRRMKKRLEMPQSERRFTRSALKVKSEETNDVEHVGVAGIDDDGVKGETEASAEASLLMTPPSSAKFSNSRLKKFPSKLKDLLATGILEGLPVMYMKGAKVVTPTVFELHAGSANKRPPEYIYIHDGNCGKTLRDVMNACCCCDFPLESMDEAVQKLLGDFTMKKSSICLNCRGACKGVSKLVCDLCLASPPQTAMASRKPNSLDNEVPPNSLDNEVQPNSLDTGVQPKSFSNGMKHSASRGKSQGRLTRKDLRLHKLVFEADVLPDGTELAYYAHGQNVFQKDRHGQHEVNALAAAGRIAGPDILELMNKRCIRVVKTVEVDHGGCALCSRPNFSKSFGPRTVIICDQCEKEYHVGCLKEHNMENLEKLPEGNWFCSGNCSHIHTALTDLVASKEKDVPDPLLSLIKKKHEEKSLEIGAGLDVKWRVMNWKLDSDSDDSVETRKLLSKAVAIFHERFDPIVDSTSGRDFIPTMLFGGDIVSAGVFRVFGSEIAELPLVATTADHQGQGYFQCLFSCIETLLGSLNVKNLVLPAADEAESIWTGKFGFTKLPQDERKMLVVAA
ncbi:hypothetical protein JHK82_037899 [Glycine max]|nr:hypothetical protein JHK82_037899 [Glycine max]